VSAPLRIGILGCGGFVRRYHVPALRTASDARLVAICDASPNDAVRAVGAEFGASVSDDIGHFLADESVEAVILSTPHGLHYEHAGRVLDAGRHLLVDKPFVGAVAEAEDLAARAAAKNLVAAVAFTRRFDKACLRARELIAAGAIGAVRYVESVQLGYERSGWFLDPLLGGGGPFTGRGSHIADLVPWLTGAAPLRVMGRLRWGTPGRTDFGGFVDVAYGGFECRMTCVEEGWHTWDEVRIFGESGMIELRRPLDLPIGWTLVRLGGNGTRIEEALDADPEPGDATRDFIAAVRTGIAPACSFADARTSVAIIEAAFASAREDGRWIDLSRASTAPLAPALTSTDEGLT
jgi:predicted dehydrogenase